MLELKDFMPINFLKKEKFTGNYKGMRFQAGKVEAEGEEKPKLSVTVWPESYGYDATPDNEKEKVLFDFNADGLAQGVNWVNQQLEAQTGRWKAASLR